MTGYQYYYHRHLPHIQPLGATFFVTFRLVGSIPAVVLQRLQEEKRALTQALDLIEDEAERAREEYRLAKLYFGRWDAALDRSVVGPRWLGEPAIAALVAESLHYRHGRVYTLHAFCIMPNHVHALYTPLPNGDTYHALSSIMQSLKRYTARQANDQLGRRGSLWQDESYDHFVRDSDEYRRIVYYIRNNPVKAGLVTHAGGWPWTYVA